MLRLVNRISGINMVQKTQRFMFKWLESDPLGGDCPILYLQVTGSVPTTQQHTTRL